MLATWVTIQIFKAIFFFFFLVPKLLDLDIQIALKTHGWFKSMYGKKHYNIIK